MFENFNEVYSDMNILENGYVKYHECVISTCDMALPAYVNPLVKAITFAYENNLKLDKLIFYKNINAEVFCLQCIINDTILFRISFKKLFTTKPLEMFYVIGNNKKKGLTKASPSFYGKCCKVFFNRVLFKLNKDVKTWLLLNNIDLNKIVEDMLRKEGSEDE